MNHSASFLFAPVPPPSPPPATATSMRRSAAVALLAAAAFVAVVGANRVRDSKFYDVLGVATDADTATITMAYRWAAL